MSCLWGCPKVLRACIESFTTNAIPFVMCSTSCSIGGLSTIRCIYFIILFYLHFHLLLTASPRVDETRFTETRAGRLFPRMIDHAEVYIPSHRRGCETPTSNYRAPTKSTPLETKQLSNPVSLRPHCHFRTRNIGTGN